MISFSFVFIYYFILSGSEGSAAFIRLFAIAQSDNIEDCMARGRGYEQHSCFKEQAYYAGAVGQLFAYRPFAKAA